MTAADVEVQNRRRLWTAPRVIAAGLLAVILLGGLLASPMIGWIGLKGPNVHDPSALNLFGNPTGPSGRHPLGVDAEGRDVLSCLLVGLRSLVLLSLAGTALGLLGGQALWALARLRRVLRTGVALICDGLAAFPPLLLGLAMGIAVGAGVWRLIAVLAVTSVAAADSRRGVGALAVEMFARAVALDFGLTFLGDGPGGASPQLGQMVARAGEGILAGVPAWWALLFPGLIVMLVLLAAAVLVPADHGRDVLAAPAAAPPASLRRGAVRQVLGAAVQAGVILLFGLCVFTAFGGTDPGSRSALGLIGPGLAATVSLLGGAAVVWVAATVALVGWTTRPGRLARPRRTREGRLGAVRRVGEVPGALLAAAPIGWLAFLALYIFSDSVGKIPILPGAGSYAGLLHAPGRWAHGLLLPWLVLGLTSAAAMAPAVSARVRAAAMSGQQRVARAAGVAAPQLARQLRRGLIAPVLEVAVGSGLTSFLGAAVLVEVTFRIPGAGSVTLSDFSHGQPASVSDVVVIAALFVVLARLVVGLIRAGLNPRVAR